MTVEEFTNGSIRLTLGTVARLEINRPDKGNAVTAAMWPSLIEACKRAIQHSEVRVLVLAGAGRHFCAGADISEFAEMYATDQTAENYNDMYRGAEAAIRNLAVPVIAEIRGACFGGGLGLALSADFRFADETAQVGITASKLGITYSAEDSARIIEKIGPGRSKDMLFSARTIDAQEALSWGLVDRLSSPERLSGLVESYAAILAARSRESLRAMKTIINSLTETDGALCQKLRPIYSELFRGKDLVEGRKAFLEKREPVFE